MKDFSNNLGRLRDGHSRAVEEEIAVRKCDVAVAHGLEFMPPRVKLQNFLLAQTALQVESAGRDNNVLGVSVAKLFGRYGG